MQHSIVSEPAATQSLRHDRVTISLHWATAIIVVVLWATGQTVNWSPNGPLRVDYRSIHIVLGIVLGLVVLARLIWRTTGKPTLPPIDHGPLLLIARVTHWALYVLLVLAIGLGIATAWVRGDAIFNLFSLSSFAPGDRPLIRLIHGWHSLAANAILIVAGVHAAAALFHHYVLRDATLQRMLPWQPR